MTDAGPLVQLQMSFSRLPWRIAPAWAVLAGAVAGGLNFGDTANLMRLLAAILLADVVWGLLRQYATAGAAPIGTHAPAVLPYATAQAPLARFLAVMALPGRGDRAGWQGALAGLVLTVVVSAVLGWQAAAASLAALALMWFVWLGRRRGDTPAFADSLLDVALPGLLGLSLAFGGEVVPAGLPWELLLVGAGFTALQWGLLRWRGACFRRGGFWFGLVALLLALIVLGQPLALTLAAALLAPAAWYVAGADLSGRERAAPWCWAALLVVAIVAR